MGIHKERKLAFLSTFLAVWLVPGIAFADVGERAFKSFALRIWNGMLYDSVIPYNAHGVIGWIASILCVGLTLYWMWKFEFGKNKNGEPRTAAPILGKTAGPFAVILIGIRVAMWAIGLAIGFVKGFISGTIMQVLYSVPILGTILGWFPKLGATIAAIVMFVVGFAFLVGMLIYVVKNAGSLIKSIFDAVIGVFKSAGGEGAPKTIFMVMGTLAGSAIINNPNFNEGLYYLPSIASSIFGVVALVKFTPGGQRAANMASSRVLGKPLDDGRYHCPNFGRLVLHDKRKWAQGFEVPLLNPDDSPKVKKKHRCGHLNAAENATCGAENCDHRHPYAPWTCPKCKYTGKDGAGIPWDIKNCPQCSKLKPSEPWCCTECGYYGKDKKGIPWKTLKCPKCRAARPKTPTSPFHYPWEDAFQAEEAIAKGDWQCKQKVPQRNPDGTLKRLRDDNDKSILKDGVPQPVIAECKTWNPKGAAKCKKCGSPNPKTSRSTAARGEAPRRAQRPIDGTFPMTLEIDWDGIASSQKCECGNDLRPRDKCCRACGKRVERPASASPPSTPPRKPKVTPVSRKARKSQPSAFALLEDHF